MIHYPDWLQKFPVGERRFCGECGGPVALCIWIKGMKASFQPDEHGRYTMRGMRMAIHKCELHHSYSQIPEDQIAIQERKELRRKLKGWAAILGAGAVGGALIHFSPSVVAGIATLILTWVLVKLSRQFSL